MLNFFFGLVCLRTHLKPFPLAHSWSLRTGVSSTTNSSEINLLKRPSSIPAKQLTAPVRLGERLDPGVAQVKRTMRYPRIVKNGYAWLLRNLYKDPMWAELVAGCSTKSVDEEWHLTVRRDIYRKKFHDAWDEAGFDLLLTVPNAIPAIPKDGMEEATVANCSYVFLFNVVSKTLYQSGLRWFD